jgi:predicted transcriptional regulator YdeE
MKAIPEITTLSEPIYAVGLMTHTSMKSVFKDLPVIYKKYMSYQEQYPVPNKKEPWEYVSLSKNFLEDQSWDYLTGHVVQKVSQKPEVYMDFEIPAGKYAVFPVRPKHKLMLGLAIGKTKRYIYVKWISKSRYEFSGYEFEYNNEKMSQDSPYYIDLYVAIKDKNQ